VDQRLRQRPAVDGGGLLKDHADVDTLLGVEQVLQLPGQRDNVGDGRRVGHERRGRVDSMDAHGLLHDRGQLADVGSAAQVVEGAAGDEFHHQHLVPGVGVHQVAGAVAVQPRVADPADLGGGDQPGGAGGPADLTSYAKPMTATSPRRPSRFWTR